VENLSKDDYLEWEEHPVTKYFFSQVRAKIIGIMKDIGEGKTYNSTSVEQTALETARAFGAVEALEDIQQIEYIEE